MLAENPEDVLVGAANLRKQLENVRAHGVEPVVAINSMPTDYPSEHATIRELAASMGVKSAVCTHFAEGGRGAAELAEAVAEVASKPNSFHHLYPAEASLREKVEALAANIYGADGVDYAPLAARQLDGYEKNGFGNLPVCVAKTQYSLSHDANLKGAPTGFRFPVREARASVGAGFVYLICGDMRTMPGLARNPAAASIDIDANGEIVGLY
jgi:formate--tetrahydrofolate ligase